MYEDRLGGHHTRIETVVNGRVWHHQLPDAFLGSGPPLLDVRLLIGVRVTYLFHVTEILPGTGPEYSAPGCDVLKSVARDLTDREDDDDS